MNNPNGPVFHDGHHHVFFQYNPHGPQRRSPCCSMSVPTNQVCKVRTCRCASVPGCRRSASKAARNNAPRLVGQAAVDDGALARGRAAFWQTEATQRSTAASRSAPSAVRSGRLRV
ncbi:hypothetical protein [Saccharothrix sp. ALI-22-I]|uniref:hypothetical protein n=1 Tax=Saccharothrix sp. ALI-22-I TaxID=1933778 RepID=UPI003FCFFCA8